MNAFDNPHEEGSEMNHKRFHGDRDRLSDHVVVDEDGAAAEPEAPRRGGNRDGRDTPDPRDPEAYYDQIKRDREPKPKRRRKEEMNDRHPQTDEPEVRLVSAADIEPEPVEWLWPGYLQCGALNLLAGQSTTGKSTIALSWAATVTSGGQWPDGQMTEPGRVVFWSGEDGIADTLVPRFLAAGGDRENMFFIGGVHEGRQKRPFDPATDMPSLARAVEKAGDVRMIVLDPVAVVVKGKDSHKNVETRVGLQPFADLLAQTGACGLGIHHFTKDTAGGNPLDRISGSLAFHALPRCVHVAAEDQNGGRDARRAIMRAKVSNGPSWGGFDYKLDQRPLDNWPQISAQRILWGDAIESSARELLAQFEGKAKAARQRQVIAFLAAALKDGPRLRGEIVAEGAKLGIPERTLYHTFTKVLGGTPERHGKGKDHFTIWELPTNNRASNTQPKAN